jgi:hypothetical protein
MITLIPADSPEGMCRNPAPKLAYLWHWKNIDKPVPGKEYQMMNYGPIEYFELIH